VVVETFQIVVSRLVGSRSFAWALYKHGVTAMRGFAARKQR